MRIIIVGNNHEPNHRRLRVDHAPDHPAAAVGLPLPRRLNRVRMDVYLYWLELYWYEVAYKYYQFLELYWYDFALNITIVGMNQ